jgi:hypothetical protein
MKLIEEVKKKREFSKLPDSIIEESINKSGGDVKEARAYLRNYFGIFLTNKVLKGDTNPDVVLKNHISSRERDYEKFYEKVFDGLGDVSSILDLGCGVNGFSYKYLKDTLGNIEYVGVEAAEQLVGQMNDYFSKGDFNARAIHRNIFDIEKILEILVGIGKPRVVFMFQVVDALESFRKDYSKEIILEISKKSEIIVISLPTISIGGRRGFVVSRKWLIDFLKKHFDVLKDIKIGNERVIVLKTNA